MSNSKLIKNQKKFGAVPGEFVDKLAEAEGNMLKRFNENEKRREEKEQREAERLLARAAASKETPWEMPIEALKVLGWIREYEGETPGTIEFEVRRKSVESPNHENPNFYGKSVIPEGGYTPIIEFKTSESGRLLWRTYFKETPEESMVETESTLDAWSRFYRLIEEDYHPDDEFNAASNMILGFKNKTLESYAFSRAQEIAKQSNKNKNDNNYKWLEKIYRMISAWAGGRAQEEGLTLWNKMDCLKLMGRILLAREENKFKNLNEHSIAYKYPKNTYPHLIYGASKKLHVIGKLSIEYWEQQALRES